MSLKQLAKGAVNDPKQTLLKKDEKANNVKNTNMVMQKQISPEQDMQIDKFVEDAEMLKHKVYQIGAELNEDQLILNDINDNEDRAQEEISGLVGKVKKFAEMPDSGIIIGCIVMTLILVAILVFSLFI